MGLKKLPGKLVRFCKTHATEILASVASCGVIATGVMSAIAMKKATDEVERLYFDTLNSGKDEVDPEFKAEVRRIYISKFAPPVMIGLGTIGAVIGSVVTGRQTKAAVASSMAILASRYNMVKEEYSEYQQRVIDIYGKDKHKEILSTLDVTKCEPPYLYSEGFLGRETLDTEDEQPTMLFFDNLSGKYFESTLSKVLQAEYHLNHNLMAFAYVTVNEYYTMFGLTDLITKDGDKYGWSMDNGVYWLDFNHNTEDIEAGEAPLSCCVIDIRWSPEEVLIE